MDLEIIGLVYLNTSVILNFEFEKRSNFRSTWYDKAHVCPPLPLPTPQSLQETDNEKVLFQ